MSITYKDITVYRPYADEVPWDLLDGHISDTTDLDYMRVAKHGDIVVGAYVMERVDELVFQFVTLLVDTPYRKRFIGRWLLGHGLGLAETKGGRTVLVPCRTAQRFFETVGFQPDGPGLRLDLTPE